jgi:leader peptidase (prepilin peptidase)/N-methyltransferase
VWVFLAALVAIAGIDLEHQLIPDTVTLPGTAVGFLTSFLSPSATWLGSLLGTALGGGLFLVVILASRGGMGAWDMKLGTLMGAFLGYILALAAIFAAVILGGVCAALLLATALRRRRDPIPFGPFLAAGSSVALFLGEELIQWYLTRRTPWAGKASRRPN